MSWSTCAVTRALRGGASAAWSVILYHPVAVFMPKFKVNCPYFGSHRGNPEQWLEPRAGGRPVLRRTEEIRVRQKFDKKQETLTIEMLWLCSKPMERWLDMCLALSCWVLLDSKAF